MSNSLHSRKIRPLVYAISLSIGIFGVSYLPHSVYASENVDKNTISNNSTQQAEENPLSKLDWHIGPKKENIANVATLNTIKDEGFLDPTNADKF